MQYEEFRVHSTANKGVYLPLDHELEVSNPECSALTFKVDKMLGNWEGGGGGH